MSLENKNVNYFQTKVAICTALSIFNTGRISIPFSMVSFTFKC